MGMWPKEQYIFILFLRSKDIDKLTVINNVLYSYLILFDISVINDIVILQQLKTYNYNSKMANILYNIVKKLSGEGNLNRYNNIENNNGRLNVLRD